MIWLLWRLRFLLLVSYGLALAFTGVQFVAKTYFHLSSIEPVREFGYYKISPIL